MSIITIDNPDTEIESLPLTQSITIRVKGLVESLQLKASIVLFRLQDDKLLNLAEPYAYTLGYIKEKFDIVDIIITSSIESGTGDTLITCKPRRPLHPSSKYAIYVSKQLSTPFITIDKTITKSESSISVEVVSTPTVTDEYTLVCRSTPYITNESNVVKFELSSNAGITNYILDLKTVRNKINTGSLSITFPDTVFANGETFVIAINPQQGLAEDLMCIVQTALSESILPIDQSLASTKVSNTAVLDYYQTLNAISSTPTVVKAVATYLDGNVFALDGLGLTKDQIDIDSLSYSIRDAFGNYLLKHMSLDYRTGAYVLYIYWDTFEERPVFELIYTDDEAEVKPIPTITIDITNW